MASDLQGSLKARDIGRTVRFTGEKMEGRAVVPDVIGLLRLKARNVRHDPVDFRGTLPKPGFGYIQC